MRDISNVTQAQESTIGGHPNEEIADLLYGLKFARRNEGKRAVTCIKNTARGDNVLSLKRRSHIERI